MRRGWLLAVLVLAPLALAQTGSPVEGWSQAGGDAAHTRQLDVPDFPLDVIATGQLLEEDEDLEGIWSPRAIETPRGVVALASPSLGATECALLRIPSFDPLHVERYPQEVCSLTGRIVGRHAEAGLVFTSHVGSATSVVLEARDEGSLEILWTVGVPADVVAVPSGAVRSNWWPRAVIEPDRVVVAFSSEAQNVVLALDLEGRVIWRTAIPASALALGELGVGTPAEDPVGAILIHQLTAAEGGYFAWGRPGASGTMAAVAWMDRDGRVRGGYAEGTRFVDDVRTSLPDPVPADTVPTAQGESAIMTMGQYIVIARVTDATPAIRPAPVPAQDGPLVWWREHLAMPTVDGVTVLAAPAFSDWWSWKPPRRDLQDLVVTQHGQLLALSSVPAGGSYEAALSWVDLSTRTELRRLALPAVGLSSDAATGAFYDPEFLPLDNGNVLLLLGSGHYVLLGAADPALVPVVDVNERHPPAGTALGLLVQRPPEAVNLTISWGDGTFETQSVSEVSHTYATPGSRVIRVTAVFPDGRTATTEIPVDVDGTPPLRLTAIQRAFSAENQELTLFLVGVALTGGGALFAALLRRRRQSNLARETRRLHELQDLAAREPAEGLAALEAHRRHLEEAHTRRRLDDAHFALLDQRTVRAMRATRLRLLGATMNALTPHFRGLLDTALDDGRISPGELSTLLAALAHEPIESPERERMRTLLGGWAR